MRIAEVIGKVTLAKRHPSLKAASWRIAVALTRDGLRGDVTGRGEPFVLFDDRGSSDGSLIAVSEGAEASAPFYPNQIPIDAYNAAILDTVDVESQQAENSEQ